MGWGVALFVIRRVFYPRPNDRSETLFNLPLELPEQGVLHVLVAARASPNKNCTHGHFSTRGVLILTDTVFKDSLRPASDAFYCLRGHFAHAASKPIRGTRVFPCASKIAVVSRPKGAIKDEVLSHDSTLLEFMFTITLVVVLLRNRSRELSAIE